MTQIPIKEDLASLFKRIRSRHGLKIEYVFIYQGQPIKGLKNGFNAALSSDLCKPFCNARRELKSIAGNFRSQDTDADHEVCTLSAGPQKRSDQSAKWIDRKK